MNYTKEYFIAKFEVIPEELWCTHVFTQGDGICCAYGHCGSTAAHPFTPERKGLYNLLRDVGMVARINDGHHERFPQPTPKQRILAALRSL